MAEDYTAWMQSWVRRLVQPLGNPGDISPPNPAMDLYRKNFDEARRQEEARQTKAKELWKAPSASDFVTRKPDGKYILHVDPFVERTFEHARYNDAQGSAGKNGMGMENEAAYNRVRDHVFSAMTYYENNGAEFDMSSQSIMGLFKGNLEEVEKFYRYCQKKGHSVRFSPTYATRGSLTPENVATLYNINKKYFGRDVVAYEDVEALEKQFAPQRAREMADGGDQVVVSGARWLDLIPKAEDDVSSNLVYAVQAAEQREVRFFRNLNAAKRFAARAAAEKKTKQNVLMLPKADPMGLLAGRVFMFGKEGNQYSVVSEFADEQGKPVDLATLSKAAVDPDVSRRGVAVHRSYSPNPAGTGAIPGPVERYDGAYDRLPAVPKPVLSAPEMAEKMFRTAMGKIHEASAAQIAGRRRKLAEIGGPSDTRSFEEQARERGEPYEDPAAPDMEYTYDWSRPGSGPQKWSRSYLKALDDMEIPGLFKIPVLGPIYHAMSRTGQRVGYILDRLVVRGLTGDNVQLPEWAVAQGYQDEDAFARFAANPTPETFGGAVGTTAGIAMDTMIMTPGGMTGRTAVQVGAKGLAKAIPGASKGFMVRAAAGDALAPLAAQRLMMYKSGVQQTLHHIGGFAMMEATDEVVGATSEMALGVRLEPFKGGIELATNEAAKLLQKTGLSEEAAAGYASPIGLYLFGKAMHIRETVRRMGEAPRLERRWEAIHRMKTEDMDGVVSIALDRDGRGGRQGYHQWTNAFDVWDWTWRDKIAKENRKRNPDKAKLKEYQERQEWANSLRYEFTKRYEAGRAERGIPDEPLTEEQVTAAAAEADLDLEDLAAENQAGTPPKIVTTEPQEARGEAPATGALPTQPPVPPEPVQAVPEPGEIPARGNRKPPPPTTREDWEAKAGQAVAGAPTRAERAREFASAMEEPAIWFDDGRVVTARGVFRMPSEDRALRLNEVTENTPDRWENLVGQLKEPSEHFSARKKQDVNYGYNDAYRRKVLGEEIAEAPAEAPAPAGEAPAEAPRIPPMPEPPKRVEPPPVEAVPLEAEDIFSRVRVDVDRGIAEAFPYARVERSAEGDVVQVKSKRGEKLFKVRVQEWKRGMDHPASEAEQIASILGSDYAGTKQVDRSGIEIEIPKTREEFEALDPDVRAGILEMFRPGEVVTLDTEAGEVPLVSVYLQAGDTTADVVENLRHAAVHVVRGLDLFDTREWDRLRKKYAPGVEDNLEAEEKIAYTSQIWKPETRFRRALANAWDAFAKRLGLGTPESVLRGLHRGDWTKGPVLETLNGPRVLATKPNVVAYHIFSENDIRIKPEYLDADQTLAAGTGTRPEVVEHESGAVQVRFGLHINPKWREATVRQLKANGADQAFIDATMRDFDEMMERIGRQAAGASLDKLMPANAEELATQLLSGPLRNNGDYGQSLDFIGVCIKRLPFMKYLDDVTNRMLEENPKAQPLNQVEREVLATALTRLGYERFCHWCYVETNRQNRMKIAAGRIRSLIDLPIEGDPPKYLTDPKFLAMKEQARKLGFTEEDIDYKAFDDTEYFEKQKADPNSAVGKFREIYQYVSNLSISNSSRTYAAEEYAGQFKAITDYARDVFNKTHGVRMQSISDAQFEYVPDLLQAFMDLHLRGASAHSYTKVPWYARMLKGTNVKLNLSLIGLISDTGEYLELTGQSFPWQEAFALRKQDPHIGTEIIAFNDNMIRWALAHPDIDYIIPWHASNMWADLLSQMKDVRQYKDYQNAKHVDKRVKGVKPSIQHDWVVDPAKRDKYNEEKAKELDFHLDEFVEMVKNKKGVWRPRYHDIHPSWVGAWKGMSNGDITVGMLKEAYRAGTRLRFYDFLWKEGEVGAEARRRYEANGEIYLDGIEQNWSKLAKYYARTDTPLEPVKPILNKTEVYQSLQDWEDGTIRVADLKVVPEYAQKLTEILMKFREEIKKDPSLRDKAMDWAIRAPELAAMGKEVPTFEEWIKTSEKRARRRANVRPVNPMDASRAFGLNLSDLDLAEEMRDPDSTVMADLTRTAADVEARVQRQQRENPGLTQEAIHQIAMQVWGPDIRVYESAADVYRSPGKVQAKTEAAVVGRGKAVVLSQDLPLGDPIAWRRVPKGTRMDAPEAQEFHQALERTLDEAGIDPDTVQVKVKEFGKQGTQIVAYRVNPNTMRRVLLHEIFGHLDQYKPEPGTYGGKLLNMIQRIRGSVEALANPESERAPRIGWGGREEGVVTTDANNPVDPERIAEIRRECKEAARKQGSGRRQYARDLFDARMAAEGWVKLSDIHRQVQALSTAYRGELGYGAEQFTPKELYADAVSAMYVEPTLVREVAPGFEAMWRSHMEVKFPELWEAIRSAGDILQAQVGPEAAGALFLEGAQQRMAEQKAKDVARAQAANVFFKATEGSVRFVGDLWERLRRVMKNRVGNAQFVVQQTAKLAKQKLEEFDEDQDGKPRKTERMITATAEAARNVLEHTYHTHSTSYLYMRQFIDKVFKPAEKFGTVTLTLPNGKNVSVKGAEAFGFWQQMRRIAEGDRGDKINPYLISKDTAAEIMRETVRQLDDQAPGVDHDTAFRTHAEAWRTLRNDIVIPMALEAGMITAQTAEMMKNDETYTPFKRGSDRQFKVMKTVGTTKAVMNPIHVLPMSDVALITASIQNQAKRDFTKFVNDNLSVEENRLVLPFRGDPKAPPAKPGYQLVRYLDNGKMNYVWMDKLLAKNFQSAEAAGWTTTTAKVLGTVNQPLRMLMYAASLKWIGSNVARDIRGTIKKNPEINAHTVEFLRNWKLAKQEMRDFIVSGKLSEDIKWLLEHGALEPKINSHRLMDPENADMMTRALAEFGEILEGEVNEKYDRLAQKYAGVGRILAGAGKAGEKILDKVLQQGDIYEAATKLAGYKSLRYWNEKHPDKALSEDHIAIRVRNDIGTPDYLKAGAWQGITNNVFLFSNIAANDIISFKDRMKAAPKNLLLWQAMNTVPSLVMIGMKAGMFGAGAAAVANWLWGGSSEQHEDKYGAEHLTFRWPWSGDGQKSIVFGLPQDYTGQGITAFFTTIAREAMATGRGEQGAGNIVEGMYEWGRRAANPYRFGGISDFIVTAAAWELFGVNFKDFAGNKVIKPGSEEAGKLGIRGPGYEDLGMYLLDTTAVAPWIEPLLNVAGVSKRKTLDEALIGSPLNPFGGFTRLTERSYVDEARRYGDRHKYGDMARRYQKDEMIAEEIATWNPDNPGVPIYDEARAKALFERLKADKLVDDTYRLGTLERAIKTKLARQVDDRNVRALAYESNAGARQEMYDSMLNSDMPETRKAALRHWWDYFDLGGLTPEEKKERARGRYRGGRRGKRSTGSGLTTY